MPADVINLPVLSDELEDSFAGATERLLTVHFGVPNLGPGAPSTDFVFRWDLPRSFQDVKGGIFGSRSPYWHPARTKTTNEGGTDGRDFNRDGDDTDSSERWD